MDELLASLRAAAEPTRLRLLALAARGAFCVTEFVEILGQSQPRLSRHLRLLCDAGLLERAREGANVWFTVPHGTEAGALAHALLTRLPDDDAVLEADRRGAARVLAERARVASASFNRQGADWDEMRALDLPAADVEAALLALLPGAPHPGTSLGGTSLGGTSLGGTSLGRVLDIGTGTGRLLELLGHRASAATGIDASRAMLALARARLAGLQLPNCAVRLGDMYRLPFPDAAFDLVVLQMVLHYAEDPAAVLAEAARVLAPAGRLVVIDLAAYATSPRALALAHRWPGFDDAALAALLAEAGLTASPARTVPGPLEIRLWCAEAAAVTLERVA